MQTIKRAIEWTTAFKRDYKREKKTYIQLEIILAPVLEALAGDNQLDAKYRDHAMSGDWKNSRNCHVKPDLVLIYQKPDAETLQLIRLGSHSELGI